MARNEANRRVLVGLDDPLPRSCQYEMIVKMKMPGSPPRDFIQ